MRPFRGLAVIFVFVFAFFMVQQAKDYYVTPVYPIPLAAGAVALERALDRVAFARSLRVAVTVLLVAGGVLLAPAVMPVLAPDAYVRYIAWLGLSPPAYIDRGVTPMPQHLADRFGWEELTRAVADVHRSLPAQERATVRIVCGNWGQAGAIDRYGPRYGLPGAISPHGSYWDWGHGEGPVGSFIVVGMGDTDDLHTYFEHVEERGRLHVRYAVENGTPIRLARGLRVPIEEAWNAVRRY